MSKGLTALEGIRVLDVTQVMAGPFCAMQLCDMGADVIKVEPPEGDPTRQMGARGGLDSAGFAALNRGKRAIVLDLKSIAGRHAFERLAARTDILIENFRPGVMRALGLDYSALSARNPRLIYASISGYGQTGPDAPKSQREALAKATSLRGLIRPSSLQTILLPSSPPSGWTASTSPGYRWGRLSACGSPPNTLRG